MTDIRKTVSDNVKKLCELLDNYADFALVEFLTEIEELEYDEKMSFIDGCFGLVLIYYDEEYEGDICDQCGSYSSVMWSGQAYEIVESITVLRKLHSNNEYFDDGTV